MRLILTLAGFRILALSLLSSHRLALAPDWLLQIFGVLVGCGGGDGAVLGGRAASLPAACRERRGAGLVVAAGAACCCRRALRGAGLWRGQDGGDVNPRQVWLRTLTCFVFGERGLLLDAPVLSLCVLVWLTFLGHVLRPRRMFAFALVSFGALLLGADARALEKHGRRCRGVCSCPAESTLLEKKHKGFFSVNKCTIWMPHQQQQSGFLTLTGICSWSLCLCGGVEVEVS